MKTELTIKQIKEKMHNGSIYQCNNSELFKEQIKRLDILFEYNHTPPSKAEKKSQLLKKMFKNIADDAYIETPFNANWAGKYVSIGKGFYANFNLTLVDDTYITIGDFVLIAPNVIICSGTHPINPNLRKNQAQYNLPVCIENNVWIGAGAIIMPGVTIGENSIIGAGSIVTKSIPRNVVAVGNPCKVLRDINDHDHDVNWD